jgi:prepilin-type N-terminal cleavage/methylation domain-containing protein/prepilin-type processing-associated H-X9-DG protein
MERKRAAFTVVELLVVIAIVGVLMALTLPAVQMARESARKVKCASNLKQIAMGALAHNTQWEYFPNAGGLDGAARSVNSSGVPYGALRQDWGVFYQILPYIEQKSTYDLTNNAQVAALTLPLYFCPTRRKPTAVSGSTQNGLTATDLRGGVDYAGSGGDGDWDVLDANGNRDSMKSHFNPFPAATSISWQTGAIIPRPGVQAGQIAERVTGASIRDGQSNVLMFGERRYYRNPPVAQTDEDNGYINGWSLDTIRFSIADVPRPDRKPISPPDNAPDDSRFGGPHSGVVMMAFCDGSVRPMSYAKFTGNAAEPNATKVFRQLTDRRDGASPQY